jgi:uncharacterized protein (DUF983 family)
MRLAFMFIVVVVVVVVAMSMFMSMLYSVEMFVHVEVGLIGVPVFVLIDAHARPLSRVFLIL